jgi:hypothetical protein
LLGALSAVVVVRKEDTLKGDWTLGKQKFQVELAFPDENSIRLDRILGVADGSSHMCSIADVLPGAFRYCVNEPENEEVGKAMFPTLMNMMWKRERGGKIYVNDCGLVFRPVSIKEKKYRAEYGSLQERLQGYLN